MDANRLHDITLFQGLSARELEQISPLLDEVDVAAGRDLAQQNALGHECFVLLEGSCDVRDGDRHIATMTAGDFFGEIALLDSERRTATVVSTTPVRLGVMTRANLRAMADRHPQIGARLRDAIAERRASDAAGSQ
jgi:CRP/FNR family cyclic AMP-dependent transcriptional regulator